ncbi:hypothetical protein [uncultured Arsenicicoccus sp.]|uniref:hypothetical protein n=1 Tax=uncultured Arsenicicoccus sp. TaxID=491339 RepID=UPI0025931555|nr:hypothetical protein [uncultured Arsenicicoccus sp.]
MRAAALIAYTFHIDPVTVLTEPDAFTAMVRLAAHKVVQNEEEAAARRARG